jgi:hypothetical protein
VRSPQHRMSDAFAILHLGVQNLLEAKSPRQTAAAIELLAKNHQRMGTQFREALDELHGKEESE